MTKRTEHAPGLLGDEQLILSKLVCSRSMLGKLNPSVQALSSVCYVNAMVKYHRRKVRQPRRPTSSSSESSSSSSTSKSSSSTSNSSSSNSSSSCSEVKKPTPRATIVVPSSLSRCHKSRVITAAEYDPRDGAGCTAPQTKLSTIKTRQKQPCCRIGTSFDTIVVNCLIACYVTSIKDLVVPGLC